MGSGPRRFENLTQMAAFKARVHRWLEVFLSGSVPSAPSLSRPIDRLVPVSNYSLTFQPWVRLSSLKLIRNLPHPQCWLSAPWKSPFGLDCFNPMTTQSPRFTAQWDESPLADSDVCEVIKDLYILAHQSMYKCKQTRGCTKALCNLMIVFLET